MSSDKEGYSSAAVSNTSYPQVNAGAAGQAPPAYYGNQYNTQYNSAYPQGGYAQQGAYPAQAGYGDPSKGPPGAQPGAYYGQSSNVVVTTAPVMGQSYVRETGPPPSTGAGLVVSVLVFLFCAWPCGVAAIVYNRKAKSSVDMGQYTMARSHLKSMQTWIIVAIITGIIMWGIIGWRIYVAVDTINKLNDNRYYYG